jgi:nucleoid-associated protein YgaU
VRWPWEPSRPTLDQRVARALERAGLLIEEITISSEHGRVTLRGPIPSPTARSRAVTAARAVDGVRAVSDLLAVLEEPGNLAPGAGPGERHTVYIVQPGDTLGAIAERMLGARRRWRDLLRLNEQIVSDPRTLQPGLRLRLPTR